MTEPRTVTLLAVFICLLVLASIAGTLPATYAQTAGAQVDVTPPVVHDKAITPAVVDTALSSQAITVSAHVTDELSGVASVNFHFKTDIEPTRYFVVSASIPSGEDELTGSSELPQYSEQGIWRLYSILAYDRVGNVRTYPWPGESWPPGGEYFINGNGYSFCFLPLVRSVRR